MTPRTTQNQAFNALIFLFRHVLKTELQDLNKTVRAKQGQKLPVVFTIDEVKELFKHLKGLHRLTLELIYGSGLRLKELARLWRPDLVGGFVKKGAHLALNDVLESIAELKYYRDCFIRT